jgi:hypothetical protein
MFLWHSAAVKKQVLTSFFPVISFSLFEHFLKICMNAAQLEPN